MADIKSLLSERMKSASDASRKMNTLAQRSNTGELSGFSGVFKVAPLTEQERLTLRKILDRHKQSGQKTEVDYQDLMAITSEVKAINNQAIMLHGERIKRAQKVLKEYKDGAFTMWLSETYGNRQTPYNFLQYYEFYQSSSPEMREKIDVMPKQAIYTLASRSGEREKKEKLVKEYQGENKKTLLEHIRKIFPIPTYDKRSSQSGTASIEKLEQVLEMVKEIRVSRTEREQIKNLLREIASAL